MRTNTLIRQLVRENRLSVRDLIQPVFIEENITSPKEIAALPGIRQIKDAQPEKILIPDICFCEYTTHGHLDPVFHA
ncbi:hypothetical protein KDD30_16410 [Photobacterium sp. GJ3]|uniref:hypothetical protein n=1 Tax=Photobacterium sp. GJ3 TaxID=2829502 RepID=UPI001B8C31B5|nr:hypothetical protein [Photobacterium sp. GJ3]QUJ69208.1 hypothetical protein KDD30_16410 [Photobacterium sp. GJ3]